MNISKSVEAISRFIIKYRIILVIIILILSVLSIPGLLRLNVSVNMGDFFLDDDPVLVNQKKFEQLFNNNDFVGVLVESENVFSRDSLEVIREVGSKLKLEVPLALEIISITEYENFNNNSNGLVFQDNKLLSTDEDIELFIKESLDNRLLKGVLFSPDKTQAWILLKIDSYSNIDSAKFRGDPLFTIGEIAYNLVESLESEDIKLTATGVPVYAFRKEAEMMSDLMLILVIGFIVAIALTTIIFRSFQGVIGTLLLLFISVISVFGLQGWLGFTTDSAFLAVPILLSMGVSIGYAVHINRYFYLSFAITSNRKESAALAISKCFKPILLTASTTIVALLSFMLVGIKPVKWVGLTSGMCIFAVFILSLNLFPIVLSFGRDKFKVGHNSRRHPLESLLEKFSFIVVNNSKIVLSLFLLIALISIFGISRLDIDFNAKKMMGTRLQHMKDQEYIGQSSIATSDTLDLVLTLSDSSFSDIENIALLEGLDSYISILPLVKRSSSLSKTFKDFNWVFHRQQDQFYKIPNSSSRLKGLILMLKRYSPEYLFSWISEDQKSTRVFIELSDFSSKKIGDNIEMINKYIDDNFPKDITYFYTGSTYQMAIMNQYITRGLITSLLTALLLISVIMIVVFKSFKLGLIAMIPNIFPILVCGGVMGLLGIPLEFVTMTVVPMIIGLAVDDTIHLHLNLKEDLLVTKNFDLSIKRSFRVVGAAITETTIILCLTFLVFTFSKVNSIIYMGVLSSTGMLSAYLADIFVSPILMKRLKKQL